MPELHWEGKGDAVKAAENVPLRVLKLDSSLSYGAADSQNMILQGDNLEVLKALLPYFRSAVKCIYIDPPYNTHAVFEHYVDNFPHSDWLSMMYPRLELLRDFLADDGFFCCEVDDSEGHYLKVLLDEIFGRENYLTTFYIQVRYPNKTLAEDSDYQKIIEQCHIYAKYKMKAKLNRPQTEYNIEKFIWKIIEKECGEVVTLGNKKVEIFKVNQYEIKRIAPALQGLKETWATGSLARVRASAGEFFELYLSQRKHIDGLGCLYKVYGIGEDGLGYRYISGPKKFNATKGKFYSGIPLNRLKELENGISIKTNPVPNFYDLSGAFGNCRLEGEVDFKAGKKPEILLKTILSYFSNEGDLVLDAFLGSGTTAAVAQKMNRRYIGIEIGDHAITHVVPRLCKVVDGEQGGISKAVNWQGGGGFKFYRLGEKLFNEVGAINPAIEFKDLAAYVWFTETNTAYSSQADSAFLGVHNGAAIYLLKEPLTYIRYEKLPPYEGEKIIYAMACRLGETFLRENKVMYKELK